MNMNVKPLPANALRGQIEVTNIERFLTVQLLGAATPKNIDEARRVQKLLDVFAPIGTEWDADMPNSKMAGIDPATGQETSSIEMSRSAARSLRKVITEHVDLGKSQGRVIRYLLHLDDRLRCFAEGEDPDDLGKALED